MKIDKFLFTPDPKRIVAYPAQSVTSVGKAGAKLEPAWG
jgi:hypothetical protein